MLNQRWYHHQDRYRPSGETINPRLYEVAPIGAAPAREFDPQPRHTAEGKIAFPGHLGTIYKAHNAVFAGMATPPQTKQRLPASLPSTRPRAHGGR